MSKCCAHRTVQEAVDADRGTDADTKIQGSVFIVVCEKHPFGPKWKMVVLFCITLAHAHRGLCSFVEVHSVLYVMYPQGKFRFKKSKPKPEADRDQSKASSSLSSGKDMIAKHTKAQVDSVKPDETEELPDLKDPEIQKATSLIQV